MSKEELIKELRKCGRNRDPEGAHIEADELLLKYINDQQITSVWNKISKFFWYA